MALPKYFGCPRSEAETRDEEDAVTAGVLRDSTFAADLAARRADVPEVNLEPFREPFRDADLADFAFKWMDLAATDERLADFFAVFDFAFAFVAMGAATYTDYAS